MDKEKHRKTKSWKRRRGSESKRKAASLEEVCGGKGNILGFFPTVEFFLTAFPQAQVSLCFSSCDPTTKFIYISSRLVSILSHLALVSVFPVLQSFRGQCEKRETSTRTKNQTENSSAQLEEIPSLADACPPWIGLFRLSKLTSPERIFSTNCMNLEFWIFSPTSDEEEEVDRSVELKSDAHLSA